MKRKLLICGTLLLCSTLVIGCGDKKKDDDATKLSIDISSAIELDTKDAAMVCTTDMDYSVYDYTMGAKYAVFATDGVVTKIVSTEVVESNDSAILSEFETYLNQNYATAANYGGYTYNVNLKNNQVISNVSIDYNEFDLDRYVVDYTTMADYLDENNKFTVESIKSMYVAMGATCK